MRPQARDMAGSLGSPARARPVRSLRTEAILQTIVEKGNLILKMAQQTRGLGHARAALFRLAKLGKLPQKFANLDRRRRKSWRFRPVLTSIYVSRGSSITKDRTFRSWFQNDEGTMLPLNGWFILILKPVPIGEAKEIESVFVAHQANLTRP